MLLMEKELELEKESVRKRNPIPYAVWLAGKGIGINSIVCLVCRKWNWNSYKIPELPFLCVLFNFLVCYFQFLFYSVHTCLYREIMIYVQVKYRIFFIQGEITNCSSREKSRIVHQGRNHELFITISYSSYINMEKSKYMYRMFIKAAGNCEIRTHRWKSRNPEIGKHRRQLEISKSEHTQVAISRNLENTE